jgi:hypothetical protein
VNIKVRINGEQVDTPIESAPDRDLQWWAANAKREDIKNACIAELERRGNGGTQRQPTPRAPASAPAASTQIVKIGDGGLLKTADGAMKKIAELQGSCHLVNSPSVGCGIPDGCAVAWSVTYVNIERDTYPIKGDSLKAGLGKDALNMVSMGMGVQWDPILSRRLDDGSDPHYCRYLAVGKMRDSDGTWITIFDEKENDLRDGSPQATDMTEKQLAQQRANIYSLTITKARNRAIRGRGVKTSYLKTELEKPFVAFKLVFTGESNDPEIRRMKARSMLESQSVLYGAAPQLPAAPLMRPPPVDTTGREVDDYDDEYGPNGAPATGTDDF